MKGKTVLWSNVKNPAAKISPFMPKAEKKGKSMLSLEEIRRPNAGSLTPGRMPSYLLFPSFLAKRSELLCDVAVITFPANPEAPRSSCRYPVPLDASDASMAKI